VVIAAGGWPWWDCCGVGGALEGIGWHGDLDEMRRNGPALDGWLNRPFERDAPPGTP